MAENLFLRPFQARKNDPLKLRGGQVRDKTSKYFENCNLKKGRNLHSCFVYRKKDGIRQAILLNQKIITFYMAEILFLRPFQARKNDPLKLRGGRVRDKTPKYFEIAIYKKDVICTLFLSTEKKDGTRQATVHRRSLSETRIDKSKW